MHGPARRSCSRPLCAARRLSISHSAPPINRQVIDVLAEFIDHGREREVKIVGAADQEHRQSCEGRPCPRCAMSKKRSSPRQQAPCAASHRGAVAHLADRDEQHGRDQDDRDDAGHFPQQRCSEIIDAAMPGDVLRDGERVDDSDAECDGWNAIHNSNQSLRLIPAKPAACPRQFSPDPKPAGFGPKPARRRAFLRIFDVTHEVHRAFGNKGHQATNHITFAWFRSAWTEATHRPARVGSELADTTSTAGRGTVRCVRKVLRRIMPDRVYLDWNATTPLRPEAQGGDGRGLGSRRQSLVGSCRGPPGAPAGRGRQAPRSLAAVGAAAAKCRLHLRRHRGQCAGADAGPAARHRGFRSSGCWFRRSSTPRCWRAGGFAPEAIETVGVTPSGVVDLDRLRAALAGGPPALVSVMLANNETGAVQPVARGGRDRPWRRRAAARRRDPGIRKNTV